MARKARQLSSTGIYHIMLRGINKDRVFFTKDDESVFLDFLAKVKERFNFSIYAYCFMENHVHLLVKESESGLISTFMKILLVLYVAWYNIEHHRCGSLFQTRFRSEPVEDARYFQQVVRYIHRNPVKAKKCKHVWQSKKSSYNLYFAQDSGIIDRDEVFEKFIPRDEFADFNDRASISGMSDICMDLTENTQLRVTNQRASAIIASVAGYNALSMIDNVNIEFLWKLTRKLRQRGLSFGQIAGELGRNKGTIYKWSLRGTQQF